jgi:hypothetical protein
MQPNYARSFTCTLVSTVFDYFNYPFDCGRRLVGTSYEADDPVSQLRHAVSILILAEGRISRYLGLKVENMARISEMLPRRPWQELQRKINSVETCYRIRSERIFELSRQMLAVRARLLEGHKKETGLVDRHLFRNGGIKCFCKLDGDLSF